MEFDLKNKIFDLKVYVYIHLSIEKSDFSFYNCINN